MIDLLKRASGLKDYFSWSQKPYILEPSQLSELRQELKPFEIEAADDYRGAIAGQVNSLLWNYGNYMPPRKRNYLQRISERMIIFADDDNFFGFINDWQSARKPLRISSNPQYLQGAAIAHGNFAILRNPIALLQSQPVQVQEKIIEIQPVEAFTNTTIKNVGLRKAIELVSPARKDHFLEAAAAWYQLEINQKMGDTLFVDPADLRLSKTYESYLKYQGKILHTVFWRQKFS